MSAIIKIGYNIIYKRHKTDKDGGEIGAFEQYSAHDGSATSEDEQDPVVFTGLGTGTADDDETLAAEDVEDAIKKLRKAKLGDRTYWESDEERDGATRKKPQWYCDTIHDIQIVRAEPVAFTTL